MERLFIEPTRSSPLVDLNDKLIIIKGQSFPENPKKFYEPIFKWFHTYFSTNPRETIIEMNLLYFNTSSTKCIMDLFDIFESQHKSGKKIVLNWYYDEENESLLEAGEEFKEDLSFNFNIISLV